MSQKMMNMKIKFVVLNLTDKKDITDKEKQLGDLFSKGWCVEDTFAFETSVLFYLTTVVI